MALVEAEPRGWKRSKGNRPTNDGPPLSQRTLPHSIEAEQGILGSMLHSPDAIAETYASVSLDYFYAPAHQTIFAAIIGLWKQGVPIDLITFTQFLTDRHLIESVGGPSLVTSLFTFVPTHANIKYYIEIVRDKYVLRQVIAASTESVRRAFEEEHEVEDLLNQVRERICSVQRDPLLRKRMSTKDLALRVIESLESPDALGISTGLEILDNNIGGFREGDNVVVAGRPSSGKSALLQLFANEIGVTRKIPVVLFTFEMTDLQTMTRLVQIRSEVEARRIARAEADFDEVRRFGAAVSEIGESPLVVVNERLDVAGIRARCMQLQPRIALIDYFQIIPEDDQKYEARTERFDRMSSSLKQMAIDLRMTIVIGSQLNEKETTYGSSKLTADADILLLVESVGEYEESTPYQDKTIKIAKQREGGRPTLGLSFQKKITKFRQRKR